MAKGRILLAHGNTDCQTIYGSALAHDGYAVDVVVDVESALQNLAGASYDLVVADLYLQSVGDECLIRRMRQLPLAAHLPVVVLTGWTTEPHRRVAMHEDADGFLPLPTRPRDLVATVASLLDQPSRQNSASSARATDEDGPVMKEF
ncbi:MAG TPA: response regulator [Gemmatimonadaceae bacterium]|nr:response regulator [Gemmatimonadaceae bacterium]